MSSSEAASRPAIHGNALRCAVRDALRKHLNAGEYEIFLFGSEADGRADARSDIDVGVLGRTALSGELMQALRDELERLRTLRSFDLVDFRTADEHFTTEALSHAERL